MSGGSEFTGSWTPVPWTPYRIPHGSGVPTGSGLVSDLPSVPGTPYPVPYGSGVPAGSGFVSGRSSDKAGSDVAPWHRDPVRYHCSAVSGRETVSMRFIEILAGDNPHARRDIRRAPASVAIEAPRYRVEYIVEGEEGKMHAVASRVDSCPTGRVRSLAPNVTSERWLASQLHTVAIISRHTLPSYTSVQTLEKRLETCQFLPLFSEQGTPSAPDSLSPKSFARRTLAHEVGAAHRCKKRCGSGTRKLAV
jgi:hypothetical protein